MPFVPGYEIAGTIDAIGPGVIGFQSDQRFAALRTFARGERLDVIVARARGRGFRRFYRRFDSVLHSWRISQTAADVRGAQGGQIKALYPSLVFGQLCYQPRRRPSGSKIIGLSDWRLLRLQEVDF
jgi:hypothetical protein